MIPRMIQNIIVLLVLKIICWSHETKLDFRREQKELNQKISTMTNNYSGYRILYDFLIVQFLLLFNFQVILLVFSFFKNIFLSFFIIYLFICLSWGLHLVAPQGLCLTSFEQTAKGIWQVPKSKCMYTSCLDQA